jgi:hypothetical protein
VTPSATATRTATRTRPFDATRIARHQRQILLQRMENPWAWTDRRFQLLSSITPS